MNDSSNGTAPSSSAPSADPLLQTEQAPSPNSSQSAPTSSRRSRRSLRAALNFDEVLTDPRGKDGCEGRQQRILDEGLAHPSHNR